MHHMTIQQQPLSDQSPTDSAASLDAVDMLENDFDAFFDFVASVPSDCEPK